jgi:DNA helicase-2/ATP-dependent DNA helicase PcrA
MRTLRDFDFANFTVSDLGLFSATGQSVHLMTYHAAKGLEFDAVVLTGLNEGRIPDFRATTADEFDEARRLLYVGITRAKRYLLYVSDREDERNPASRYLGNSGLGLA